MLDRVMEQGTLESKYTGKLQGDKIKGTIEILWLNRGDTPTKIDWNAVRSMPETR